MMTRLRLGVARLEEGQVLIEVLVGLAVLSVLGLAVATVSYDALVGSRVSEERGEAHAYAQEGLEAARQIRDRSWGLLTTGNHGVVSEQLNVSRYIQYQGVFAETAASGQTPVLENVTINATSPPATFTDTTSPDFSAGALGPHLQTAAVGDGAVRLIPGPLAEAFSGTGLPAEWFSLNWASGGSATVSGGLLRVDGSRAGQGALVSPGRALEAVATFATDLWQHVGFGLTYEETPYAIFSTFSGGGLYARTNNWSSSTDTLIAGSWLCSPHTYKIVWGTSSVDYYIDGSLVVSHAIAISASMRPLVSDLNVGGAQLTVDSLTLDPGHTSGTFTSRIFDGGGLMIWGTMAWTATVPAGTSLSLSVRTGNTVTPDSTWSSFRVLTSSGAQIPSETRYTFSGTSDARQHYTRTVIVEEVQRDGSGNILAGSAVCPGEPPPAPSPPPFPSSSPTPFPSPTPPPPSGTPDSDTRRVLSCVSWTPPGGGRTRTVSLTTYLTNWDAISWTETLKSEFEQGARNQTEVITAPAPPTGNGSVRLQGLLGEASSLTVKGSVNFNLSGPTDGRDVAVANGYAYFVTGSNAGGAAFYVVDVSTPSSPQVVGSVDPGGRLIAVAVSGNYAYVATDRNQGELRVINISNPLAPTAGAEVNLPGNASALSVAVDGNRLYVGTSASSTSLHLLSLADPANPTLTQSRALTGNPDARAIFPAGQNRVYVATSADSAEIQIVDVSGIAGVEDLVGTSDASSVWVSGNRAYVTREGDTQFVVLDTSLPDNPAPLGSLNLGAPAKDVAIAGSHAYVAGENTAQEFQRVDITNPSAPVLSGTTNLDGAARAVFVSGTCAYLATDGNLEELAIVCGIGTTQPLSILGTHNLPGNSRAQAIALQGTVAFVGTGGSTGGAYDRLWAVDVSSPALPVGLGSLNVGGDVRDVVVSGSYAYLATANPTGELTIVDVSNPASMHIVGTYDAARPGRSVALTGPRYALLGTAKSPDARVFVLDISTPTTPSFVGQTAATDADVTDIAVGSGNIAYVSLAHDAAATEQSEVRRVDLSNVASPVLGSGFDGSASTGGSGVALSGASIFHSSSVTSGSGHEFFIVKDVSGTLSLHVPTSSFDVSAPATAVAKSDVLAFLTTTDASKAFVVLDVGALGSPLLRNSIALPAAAHAETIVGSYAYVAEDGLDQGANPPELVILRGIDSVGYGGSGTIDSIFFDAGSQRQWQTLSWSGDTNGGSFKFRVRWANPSPTCTAGLSAVQFVGPNDDPAAPANPSAFYTASGAAITDPAGQQPITQCFQWRATLEGPGNTTPELKDVTVVFR